MGELLMQEKYPSGLMPSARDLLLLEWTRCLVPGRTAPKSSIPGGIQDAIERSINSTTLTYRYVLPTQVLAKAVNPDLDCRSVQAGSGLEGAFDARSLCHDVIVEFDRTNHSVLGGSKEPYLNNPLRIPSISGENRKAQKNKDGFDDLCVVLEYVQQNRGEATVVLREILNAIRRRLDAVSIVYPVPNRVSLKQVQAIMHEFLRDRTGGKRLQIITVALFRCIGSRFNLFHRIVAGKVNASDASTGNVADLECLDDMGNVVMGVEVKDRQLTLRQIEDKLPGVRSKGVRELLFLVQGGIFPDDTGQVDDLIEREFTTGQNLYVLEFQRFVESCLALLGETGRRGFLIEVGIELDRQREDISHRRKWKDLLTRL
ncbi:MAG: hypothetical protein GHCLOJNM_01872 [bacterium]|nr:hypothetical protein [bacterium]